MFASFAQSFETGGVQPSPVWGDAFLLNATGYAELAGRFAGIALDGGLYRIHDASSGPAAQSLLREAFPDYAPRVRVFGQDWQGNQYALDNARREGSEPLVIMFEIGSLDAFEVPADLVSFHEDALPADRDIPLAASRYAAWRRSASDDVPLLATECVGQKVPDFLGGTRDVGNLARTDLEVHWSLTAQLFAQSRGLPDGTPIGGARGD